MVMATATIEQRMMGNISHPPARMISIMAPRDLSVVADDTGKCHR
jgi:hypothetical protein